MIFLESGRCASTSEDSKDCKNGGSDKKHQKNVQRHENDIL